MGTVLEKETVAEGTDPPVTFPQTTVECDGCGAVFDVIWFCKNCPASLCNDCKEEHAREKFLKKHEVVHRTGNVLWSHGSWKLKETCEKHMDRDLITYCNDCKTPCCLDCMEENHKSHDWIKLNTKYFDAECRLNSLIEEVSKSSISTIQNEISKLKEKIRSCDEDFSNVNFELNSAEDKSKHVIVESFEQLRKDLNERKKECISKIHEKIENYERQITDFENLIASTEQKIKTGGLNLIDYYPERPQILISHSDESTPIPCFVFNEEILDELKSNIGKITYVHSNDTSQGSSVEGQQMSLERDVHSNDTSQGSSVDGKQMCLERDVHSNFTSRGKTVDGQQMSLERDDRKPSTPDVKVEKIFTFKAAIRGRNVKPVGDGTAWVSHMKNEEIRLYDNMGRIIREGVIHGSKGVRDMVVKNNGDIIVSSRDNKIRRVSVNNIVTILLDAQPFSPQGVCLTDKEEIVVCMTGKGTENHIAMYTHDGVMKVRNIIARDASGKLLLTDPHCLVINDNQMTVLNNQKSVVSIDIQSEKVGWVYDGGQARLSKPFKPSRMCQNKFSNLLLTDVNNHCIHYIDKQYGGLLDLIMMKKYGLDYPFGIGVDNQSGCIWLGSSSSEKILILKYLK